MEQEGQQGRLKMIAPTQVQEVAKALSGDLRIRIVEILGEKSMSVSGLAKELGVAQPTVSINVQILEQAGLIETAQGTSREKICYRNYDTLLCHLPMRLGEALHSIEEITMPIGLFTDFNIGPPCGLVSREGVIGCFDDPRSFYLPERSEACLLWFHGSGYVEYRFPNPMPPGVEVDALLVSAELCSEATGFQHDCPSDITLSINNIKLGTWSSPGDFGEPRGQYTPSWWVGNTQYGLLTEWRIDRDGSYINDRPAGNAMLSDLKLRFDQPITIRFEVQPEAENRRGMNLMGAGFGNYEQGLKLTFVRKRAE